MNKQNKKQSYYTIYVKKQPFSNERVAVKIADKKVSCSCQVGVRCNHITQALEVFALLQLARIPEGVANGK